MPVIRISNATYERLKTHARPFEDKPEDIINMALDALDENRGRKPDPEEKPARKVAKNMTQTGPRLPQSRFRIPVMETVLELGGSAQVSEIRKVMEKKMTPLLSERDHEIVTSGDPRWWNAVVWERHALVKEGLFENSKRGVWELTKEGKAKLKQEGQ